MKEGEEEQILHFGEKVLANPEYTKVFWNARFDIPVLQKYGLTIRGSVCDAMIGAQMAYRNERGYGLKHFSGRFLDDLYEEEDRVKKYVRKHKCSYGEVPKSIIGPYALKDAQRTFQLWAIIRDRLRELEMSDLFNQEMRVLRIVLDMEKTGIQVDKDALRQVTQETTREAAKYKDEIRQISGVEDLNPNSPVQLRDLIYGGGISPRRYSKRSGQPSTDRLALLQVGTDLTRVVDRFRRVQKARSTYGSGLLNALDDSSRLHASFNQGVAITGRFSSSKPNLQNIPRPSNEALGRIRNCFVASSPERRLVFIDYNGS